MTILNCNEYIWEEQVPFLIWFSSDMIMITRIVNILSNIILSGLNKNITKTLTIILIWIFLKDLGRYTIYTTKILNL